jgi:hypothetical protein
VANALIAVFVVACAVGVIAWFLAVWNLLRIPFNLKPGVERWPLGNPFNNLFKAEALTTEGLAARRRVGVSLGVFGGALAVGAVAGVMTKWLAS